MSITVKYLWKKRLIPANGLNTTEGEPIRIIDYGKPGNNEGIFNNAIVEIAGIVWAGDVLAGYEIQECRECDKPILLVAANPAGGNYGIKTLCLNLQPALQKELYEVIELRAKRFNCSCAFASISGISFSNILSRLLVERLDEKAANIEKRFELCNRNWDDTLFKNLVRSFGFGIQSKEFEEFANFLNMQALGKHRDNSLQVEAIFFGQAGLLEEESIPYYYREEALESSYYKELTREYRFLASKFGLGQMDYRLWGNGHATPHLRIARLAAIYQSRKFNLAEIASCNTVNELYTILCTSTQGYWHNRSCFGGTENSGNGTLKMRQADVLIINTIIPILYVYGKHRGDSNLCSKAEDYLYSIKAEENNIIKKWKEQGITPQCAADTQALLQLTRSFCQTNSCKECPVAYYHIKKRMAQE